MRLPHVLTLICALTAGQMLASTALAAGMHSPPAVDATALKLADTVFAPATLLTEYSGPQTPADADKNYFKGLHTQTYTALALSGAYFQTASWTPAVGQEAGFVYQGNVFPSADAAFAAFQDALAGLKKLTYQTITYCGGNNFSCRSGYFTTSDGKIYSYTIALAGSCTAEVSSYRTSALDTGANRLTMGKISNQVDAAARAALMSACSPDSPRNTSFKIDASKLVVRGQSDLDFTPSLKTAKVRQPYEDVILLELNVAPSNSPMKISLVATVAKKTVFKYSGTDTLNKPDTSLTASDTLPYTYYPGFNVTFKKPGKYTLKVTLTINGQTKTTSLKVKVK